MTADDSRNIPDHSLSEIFQGGLGEGNKSNVITVCQESSGGLVEKGERTVSPESGRRTKISVRFKQGMMERDDGAG